MDLRTWITTQGEATVSVEDELKGIQKVDGCGEMSSGTGSLVLESPKEARFSSQSLVGLCALAAVKPTGVKRHVIGRRLPEHGVFKLKLTSPSC